MCCSIERQKRANSWVGAKQELVEELELALRASYESATDAEELSEHLDNLERLLDRLNSLEEEASEEGHLALKMVLIRSLIDQFVDLFRPSRARSWTS